MKKILILLATSFAAFTPLQNALAHISYTGRNFGTLVIGAPASSINNQTMSSAFGWADATDSDWGDSHRGRFFRFTLSTTASVMVSVQRNSSGNGTVGTFLPAISVYSGLAQGTVTVNQTLGNGTTITRTEALAHDGSALSVSARGSAEGSLQTLANFSIGNDPTYVVDDVIHYCVTNMPGGVPRTSAVALNNATLPYVLALADKGVARALADDPHLRNGLNVHAGRITHQAVAAALGEAFVDPVSALRT